MRGGVGYINEAKIPEMNKEFFVLFQVVRQPRIRRVAWVQVGEGGKRIGRPIEKQWEVVGEITDRRCGLSQSRVRSRRQRIPGHAALLREVGNLFQLGFQVPMRLVRKHEIESQKPGADELG